MGLKHRRIEITITETETIFLNLASQRNRVSVGRITIERTRDRNVQASWSSWTPNFYKALPLAAPTRKAVFMET